MTNNFHLPCGCLRACVIAVFIAITLGGCKNAEDSASADASKSASNLPTSHPDYQRSLAASDSTTVAQLGPKEGEPTGQSPDTAPDVAAALPAAEPAPVPRKPFKPVPGTTWQWQLTGALNTSYDVDVYDIDLFDTPQAIIEQLHNQGRSVICYFSAGSFEDWRMDAADFPDTTLGQPLGDWPGERWIDIRSAQVRELMQVRLNLAKLKGCDAVEPDNVDSYTHDTGFPLTASDQLDYNRWLAKQAHDRGLLVGLKNNLDQIQQLEPHFDFAINEQCSLFAECQGLKVFVDAGKAVFRAEYDPTLLEDEILKTSLCEVSNRNGHSTLILPQMLNDRFRFDCLQDK